MQLICKSMEGKGPYIIIIFFFFATLMSITVFHPKAPPSALYKVDIQMKFAKETDVHI